MNIRTYLQSIILNLFLTYSAFSQVQDTITPTKLIRIPISKPRFKYIQHIGIGVGIGASRMDLSKINQRLNELQIGSLDNYTASRTISLYGGNDYFGLGVDLNWETAFENTPRNTSNTYLNLETFSFGSALYHTLYHSDRCQAWLRGGLSYTYMAFEYNVNTAAATSFGSLFTTPTSTVVRLESNENYTIPVGAKFFYRLGKLDHKKPRAYKFGLDTGYTFCFLYNEWQEAGSKSPVRDMPSIKPTNFYMRFTFSVFFQR